MAKVTVIANRQGGRAASLDVAAVQDAFRRLGVPARVVAVEGEGLAEAGEAAVAHGADVLVAAGGDGTVSCLAGVAVRHRVPFAVLPLGTMNHFAKDAGLPLGLEEAARIAVDGRPRPVDVGQVGQRVFVNNVSIGLYPSALRERDRRQSRGLPKAMAMVGAAATVLRQVPAHHLRLDLDGHVIERTTSLLFVGNNQYGTALADLGTRTSLSEGVLSMYTMRRPGRRVTLRLAAQALLGRLDEARDFEARTGRELTVASARPALRMGIDGEAVVLPTPLRFRISPKALRLMEDG